MITFEYACKLVSESRFQVEADHTIDFFRDIVNKIWSKKLCALALQIFWTFLWVVDLVTISTII